MPEATYSHALLGARLWSPELVRTVGEGPQRGKGHLNSRSDSRGKRAHNPVSQVMSFLLSHKLRDAGKAGGEAPEYQDLIKV